MIYKIVRLVFQIAQRLFFGRVEVQGIENVPKSGPVLLVANHVNALVDPLVIAVYLDRPLTLTAKHTLLKNPVFGLLFRAFNVITFQRSEDVGKGAGKSRNLAALDECTRRLQAGGAICIFPEGKSHSESQLRPFKYGAARIALDYTEFGSQYDDLQIVPAALHFEKKDRLRTSVWLRFGDSISMSAWRAAHPQGDPPELTSEIEKHVWDLTHNFENERESLLLNWASEVLVTQGTLPPMLGLDEGTYVKRLELLSRLKSGYEQLNEEHPHEISDLGERVQSYRAELYRLGIAPAEVYIPMHPLRAAFFVLRELELFLVGFPVAIWGVINHMAPLLVVRALSQMLTDDEDQWASNTLLPSIVLFPLFYVVQIAIAWVLLPPLWTAVYGLVLPYSGVVYLLYRERVGSTLVRTRTFFRFLFDRRLQSRLVTEGRSIIAEINRLAGLLSSQHTGGVAGP